MSKHAARFLAQIQLLNLTTNCGDFDLSFTPAGTEGYEDLATHLEHYDLEGLVIPVAALEDVIRSKRAAGRPKDVARAGGRRHFYGPLPDGSLRAAKSDRLLACRRSKPYSRSGEVAKGLRKRAQRPPKGLSENAGE
jgi:hypothetical protein